MKISFLFHSQFLFIGHWCFITCRQRSPLSHADNQSSLRPFLLSQYPAKLLGEVALTTSPRHHQSFSLSKLEHFTVALPRFFFQGFSSSQHCAMVFLIKFISQHFAKAKASKTFFFIKVISQHLAKVFFIKFISQHFTKVFLHQIYITSQVVQSLGNVAKGDCWLASHFISCDQVTGKLFTAKCLDLWAVGNGRSNCHHRG